VRTYRNILKISHQLYILSVGLSRLVQHCAQNYNKWSNMEIDTETAVVWLICGIWSYARCDWNCLHKLDTMFRWFVLLTSSYSSFLLFFFIIFCGLAPLVCTNADVHLNLTRSFKFTCCHILVSVTIMFTGFRVFREVHETSSTDCVSAMVITRCSPGVWLRTAPTWPYSCNTCLKLCPLLTSNRSCVS
jgi:hypothetical protein